MLSFWNSNQYSDTKHFSFNSLFAFTNKFYCRRSSSTIFFYTKTRRIAEQQAKKKSIPLPNHKHNTLSGLANHQTTEELFLFLQFITYQKGSWFYTRNLLGSSRNSLVRSTSLCSNSQIIPSFSPFKKPIFLERSFSFRCSLFRYVHGQSFIRNSPFKRNF
ncbi:Uncharacterised protein [Chlamydia trachomatis]|nr:Uncharacterised protein [Chlamydia trachomatis]